MFIEAGDEFYAREGHRIKDVDVGATAAARLDTRELAGLASKARQTAFASKLRLKQFNKFSLKC